MRSKENRAIIKYGLEASTNEDGTFELRSNIGPVDIGPGEEAGVTLTCSYYGMGEAVIWGELVDAE